MEQKQVRISLLFFVIIFITTLAFSQDKDLVVIKGVIEKIDENEKYMVVNGQRVLISSEDLEEFYMDVGDPIKITVRESKNGLTMDNYEYYNDDENEDEGYFGGEDIFDESVLEEGELESPRR
ncbi:MAG: hypothetical protein ISS45_11055 [Candidatus Omnitrophica bacterium]|nr:hypothetical protein [Candidatus Omnitrophota bacterium]